MMLYPADHEITVEELRELVGDDNEDAPLFDDERYEAWIERYPDDWRMAAIAASDRVLMQIASRPNRLASDGDSIAWSDERIKILRDKHAALVADVNADGYGGIVTVQADYLTGGVTWH